MTSRETVSEHNNQNTPEGIPFGKLGDFGRQTRRLWSANSATLVSKLGDFGQQDRLLLASVRSKLTVI